MQRSMHGLELGPSPPLFSLYTQWSTAWAALNALAWLHFFLQLLQAAQSNDPAAKAMGQQVPHASPTVHSNRRLEPVPKHGLAI